MPLTPADMRAEAAYLEEVAEEYRQGDEPKRAEELEAAASCWERWAKREEEAKAK